MYGLILVLRNCFFRGIPVFCDSAAVDNRLVAGTPSWNNTLNETVDYIMVDGMMPLHPFKAPTCHPAAASLQHDSFGFGTSR